MDNTQEPAFVPHPVQLTSVMVRELYIKANKPPDKTLEVDGGEFSLAIGHSEYDEEEQAIMVGIKLEVGEDDSEDSPFTLKIELVGRFELKEGEISDEDMVQWAVQNAPFTLIPYLREHAFALTARCGFNPMLIPLIQIPVQSLKKHN